MMARGLNGHSAYHGCRITILGAGRVGVVCVTHFLLSLFILVFLTNGQFLVSDVPAPDAPQKLKLSVGSCYE